MARMRFGCQQSKAPKMSEWCLPNSPDGGPDRGSQSRHRVHLQLCAAHGWATNLDGIESPSPYRIATAALGQLLVLAKSVIRSAMQQRRRGSSGRIRQHVSEFPDTSKKCAGHNRSQSEISKSDE
jgi:hypothetical protein